MIIRNTSPKMLSPTPTNSKSNKQNQTIATATAATTTIIKTRKEQQTKPGRGKIVFLEVINEVMKNVLDSQIWQQNPFCNRKENFCMWAVSTRL